MALGSYDRAWLGADLVAGVSVAAVAVPIAIAYSQLAGVPPVNGLYASILPLVAYAVFGTSRQLIVAPDAATCAIIASVVVPLAGGDVARHVSLAMTLSVITGVMCIAAGLGRLGFLANFLSRPILAGYLNGIAISIITGQLGKLSGVQLNPVLFARSQSSAPGRASARLDAGGRRGAFAGLVSAETCAEVPPRGRGRPRDRGVPVVRPGRARRRGARVDTAGLGLALPHTPSPICCRSRTAPSASR